MPAQPTSTEAAAVTPDPDHPLDLVVVHCITVLSAKKGWRVTVRVTDGWQGPTLTFWSRGGSDLLCGAQKATSDLETAYSEALEHMTPFP